MILGRVTKKSGSISIFNDLLDPDSDFRLDPDFLRKKGIRIRTLILSINYMN